MKYNNEISTNKAFLGYVNTLLREYCLKITSSRIRLKNLKDVEKNKMTIDEIENYNVKKKNRIIIYNLERLYNIDEIIDYKIRKKYKLIDKKNIRQNYTKTEIFKDLINQ